MQQDEKLGKTIDVNVNEVTGTVARIGSQQCQYPFFLRSFTDFSGLFDDYHTNVLSCKSGIFSMSRDFHCLV